MLGFAGLALVQWQSATSRKRRPWTLLLLWAALAGALLSHCYAILFYVPIAGAELARLLKRKKPDWPLWAAIAAAFPAVLTYLPLMASTEKFRGQR